MKIKSKLLFKTLIILLFLPLMAIHSFPRIFANGSGSGYQTGEENLNGAANEIESIVIRGACEYLQAYAENLIFFKQLEINPLQGIDLKACQERLDRSLSHLDQAMETYKLLIQRAENTPYNETVLSRLRDFDYKGFMNRKGFDGEIFKQVKEHLIMGDITGFYKMIYNRMNRIRSILETFNIDFSKNKMPSVTTLWQLNRMYYDTLMAGQFVAIVFNTVN